MHKADYNKISFDHKEIVLVNTLVSKEFKSVDFWENIKIKTKINELCYKFRVSSFEELVRIIIFYKLFDIDISDEYYEYIESYSREKISIQIYTRNIILDIAKNTSEIFSDFCNSFPLIGLEEYKDKLDEYINIINSDNETIHSINHIRDFINLVNNKHDFEQIFDIVFDLDDIEYIEDADRVADIFNSYAAKYLFIARILIDYSFPLNLRREITQEEKSIIRFLLYKGDEIDYMRIYNIEPLIFNDKLNSIIHAYDSENLQEMLLKANLETTLSESSLICSYFRLHLRAEEILNHREEIIEQAPIKEKQEIAVLIDELKTYINEKFLTSGLLDDFLDHTEYLKDSYYSINGKIESIKDWFTENIQSLDNVEKIQYIVNKIDDIVQYINIVGDEF